MNLYRYVKKIPYNISDKLRQSKLDKIMEHSCWYSNELRNLLKLPNIDEILKTPNSVVYRFIDQEWYPLFIHVCKSFDVYGKGAEYLFESELDSFKLKKEQEKKYKTYKQLIQDMASDVYYCSDRWSLGRLLRNHWIYQYIKWGMEARDMKHLDGNIVLQEQYKGYNCIVKRGFNDCPCGYVDVTDDSVFKDSDEEFCDENLYPHGGVTFYGPLIERPDNIFIGFDMLYYPDLTDTNDLSNIKSKYSYEDCMKETKNLVAQILEYHESEKK